MPNIDYKIIFDAAASALDASSNVIIEAKEPNTYSAGITMENGTVIKFTAIPGEYSLELSLPKESLERREYIKFMSRFEFNLEQKFFKNIKFDPQETSKDYRIKISL
ncbi:MAG TPA: hypothetical protein PK514_09215 [Spirochaetota bacterium]|nr:hypothetical protein [Spirochaetota bacterium]